MEVHSLADPSPWVCEQNPPVVPSLKLRPVCPFLLSPCCLPGWPLAGLWLVTARPTLTEPRGCCRSAQPGPPFPVAISWHLQG